MRRAVSKSGLHARPAAVFVKAVLESGAVVRIGRAQGGGEASESPGTEGLGNWAALAGSVGSADSVGGPVDARSIVSVLALDIKPGEAVLLAADDADLLGKLAGLLEADLPGIG